MRRLLPISALLVLLVIASCHQPNLIWLRTNGTVPDAATFQRDAIDCEAAMRAGAASFGTGIFAQDLANDFLRRCMNARGYTLAELPEVKPSGHAPNAARLSEQRCRDDCTRGQRDAQCFDNCKQLRY